MSRIKDQAQEKIQDVISDVFRKVPKAAGEMKLPKEVVSSLLMNLENIRSGLLGVLSKEVELLFSNVDVEKLILELTKNYKIKINAEVKFEPKEKPKRKKRKA